MTFYANIACDLPRDPRMIKAGWKCRAVYVEAVLFARENLTDGILESSSLIVWMPDVPPRTRTKYLDRLVEVGALERTDTGWRIPEGVWRKWNPTRSEVESKRQAERERKAAWREKKRAEQYDCPEDVPTGHAEVSQRDRPGTDANVPEVSQTRQRQRQRRDKDRDRDRDRESLIGETNVHHPAAHAALTGIFQTINQALEHDTRNPNP